MKTNYLKRIPAYGIRILKNGERRLAVGSDGTPAAFLNRGSARELRRALLPHLHAKLRVVRLTVDYRFEE